MLRHRLVTVLTFNEGVLFRTKLFEPDYRYTLNFVDSWLVDEIVVLDVTREPTSAARSAFEDVVREFARRAAVPLAVGGGVRDIDSVRRLMALGADKVVVNTALHDRPGLIGEIAGAFGSQCVVASIDARRDDATWRVSVDCGRRPIGAGAGEWARRCVELGAGEVLVTSIDRDGSLEGYDIALCREVVAAVRAPVLIAGGAGAWPHFVAGIREGGAQAVCTSNVYHFTEASIRSAKSFMHRAGLNVRLT